MTLRGRAQPTVHDSINFMQETDQRGIIITGRGNDEYHDAEEYLVRIPAIVPLSCMIIIAPSPIFSASIMYAIVML